MPDVIATDKFLPTPSLVDRRTEESDVQSLKAACVRPNEPEPEPPYEE